MKLKIANIEPSKKDKQVVRKYATIDEAFKSKHDLAREFFKNVVLPQ
jgi:hypothetical protein